MTLPTSGATSSRAPITKEPQHFEVTGSPATHPRPRPATSDAAAQVQSDAEWGSISERSSLTAEWQQSVDATDVGLSPLVPRVAGVGPGLWDSRSTAGSLTGWSGASSNIGSSSALFGAPVPPPPRSPWEGRRPVGGSPARARRKTKPRRIRRRTAGKKPAGSGRKKGKKGVGGGEEEAAPTDGPQGLQARGVRTGPA